MRRQNPAGAALHGHPPRLRRSRGRVYSRRTMPTAMQFGLMMRAQFPAGDDMQARFRELAEQARLADQLGYASITNGMHYSSAPWQDLQQMPFLCRIMAEAPHVRINFGLVLLSLHKPLDVADQVATADVLSGGKVIFGAALGYRDVERGARRAAHASRGSISACPARLILQRRRHAQERDHPGHAGCAK